MARRISVGVVQIDDFASISDGVHRVVTGLRQDGSNANRTGIHEDGRFLADVKIRQVGELVSAFLSLFDVIFQR